MNARHLWTTLPAVLLSLSACKKDTSTAVANPDAVAPGTGQAGVVPNSVKPLLSSDERAQRLGFSRYLTSDTPGVFSVFNGAATVERAKKLKVWKLIEDLNQGVVSNTPKANDERLHLVAVKEDDEEPIAESETDPESEATDPKESNESARPAQPEISPGKALGLEVTIAVGKSAPEQMSNLLTVNKRMTYFQMASLAKVLAQTTKSGDLTSLMEQVGSRFSKELANDLLNDPESGMKTINDLAMPPVYIATKVAAQDMDDVSRRVTEMLAILPMIGEGAVQPVTVDKGGSKFSGYKILGAKLAEDFEKDTTQDLSSSGITRAQLTQITDAFKKKNIVIMTGCIGDYVVLFLGGTVDELQLATEAKTSLAGSQVLAFTDAYAKKDLAALLYVAKDSTERMNAAAGGLEVAMQGLRDGFHGSTGLGDTTEIESLLSKAVDQGLALRKLTSIEATGSIAYFEEGMKIESFGGIDMGAVDWKTPARLSHLGDSPDVAIFANMTGDKLFAETQKGYVEAAVASAYAIAQKVAIVPGEASVLVQFREGMKLFDTKLKNDFLTLNGALCDGLGNGIGRERAFVFDMKGSFPTIPGVPQQVVDKGRIPRMSLIAPVVDRAKLSTSWDKINGSLTRILATASEISGTSIPMQKPMSSEKNGNVTWFFPFPFFNDDFSPSVTVGDKWFVTSTSKSQSLDLIAKAETPNEVSAGVRVKVNFVTVQNYAREMFKVIDENRQAILKDQASDFESNKAKIQKSIDVLDDYDFLSMYCRKEGNLLRSSVHFKTR